MGGILAQPEVQIVSVCDVEKDGRHYLEWSKNDVRNTIRRLIDNPKWREGSDFTPGGRDVGKEVVEAYYAKQRGKDQFKGVTTYVDFRELLDKEKDVTAIKIMTPDHTHAAIALAALKLGKNVITHKPLANRLVEARAVIDAARTRNIATHFMPASEGAAQKQAIEMIKSGAIGTLREIHNWSMRPMWPQFATLPTETPAIPAGFDWTLWLGPSLDRPYHPNYTHTNFRGWYEFGGGSIADMGHYSLWPIFQLLDLDSPDQRRIHAEPRLPRLATTFVRASRTIIPFPPPAPSAFVSRRKAIASRWISTGMTAASNRPFPTNSMSENKELAEEGMLFVGDKGKILGGFRSENPTNPRRKRCRASAAPPPPPIATPIVKTATPRGSPLSKAARAVTAIFNWPGRSRI